MCCTQNEASRKRRSLYSFKSSEWQRDQHRFLPARKMSKPVGMKVYPVLVGPRLSDLGVNVKHLSDVLHDEGPLFDHVSGKQTPSLKGLSCKNCWGHGSYLAGLRIFTPQHDNNEGRPGSSGAKDESGQCRGRLGSNALCPLTPDAMILRCTFPSVCRGYTYCSMFCWNILFWQYSPHAQISSLHSKQMDRFQQACSQL